MFQNLEAISACKRIMSDVGCCLVLEPVWNSVSNEASQHHSFQKHFAVLMFMNSWSQEWDLSQKLKIIDCTFVHYTTSHDKKKLIFKKGVQTCSIIIQLQIYVKVSMYNETSKTWLLKSWRPVKIKVLFTVSKVSVQFLCKVYQENLRIKKLKIQRMSVVTAIQIKEKNFWKKLTTPGNQYFSLPSWSKYLRCLLLCLRFSHAINCTLNMLTC